jgi:hypothetical protein
MRVALLYAQQKVQIPTVRDHLDSIKRYSKHRIDLVPAAYDAPFTPLNKYDAVILHYGIRLCYHNSLSPRFVIPLVNYGGRKLTFRQDEHEAVAQNWQWMKLLGVDTVFTCLPETAREWIYPMRILPNVRFVEVLTGYVSEYFANMKPAPLKDRKTVLGYRAQQLPASYGQLGKEKFRIGAHMRQACEARKIPADIKLGAKHSIYGDKWAAFLQSCRSFLVAEGGASIIDWANVYRGMTRETQWDKAYDSLALDRFEQPDLGIAKLSPKIFECAATGTAIVAHPGNYSGVMKPEHCVTLEKNFSNVNKVCEILQDDKRLCEITSCARADLIESGKYDYHHMVAKVDGELGR